MKMGTGPIPYAPTFGGNPCANHPEQPAETLCARCGDFICAWCARPSHDGQSTCARCFAPEAGYGEGVPWEQREEKGLVEAFWETAMGGVFSPATFYGQIDPLGPYKDPLIFMIINTYIAVFASVIFEAVALAVGAGSDMSQFADEFGMGSTALLLIGLAVLGPLVATPFYFVQAGIFHIFCMLVGADDGGFRGTFRGMAYTSGLQLFAGGVTLICALFATAGFVLPKAWDLASMMSGLLGFGLNIYSMVLITFMVRAIHRTSTGRAVAAVVIPVAVIFLVVCSCAFLAAFMAGAR